MEAALIRSQESRGSSASTSMTRNDHESGGSDDARPWNEDNAPIVLVLVGLIASGKSTFAKALEECFPEFRRCNQDELGDRKAVEQLARTSLRQGLSICVDRTNFDEIQRSHWIKIAKEFPRARLWCIIFDTPVNICKERLQSRTNHPTIHSPKQGIEVLFRFKNMFTLPSADEGFERICSIKPQDHPSAVYTRDELETLLVTVATSTPPERSAPQRGIRDYFEPVTPHGSGSNANWRVRDSNRTLSNHDTGFGRYAKKSGSSGAKFRPRQSSSSGAWQTRPGAVQTKRRMPHERVENAFQGNDCRGMAPEKAVHINSQLAPDRTTPSKQATDGTTQDPILID